MIMIITTTTARARDQKVMRRETGLSPGQTDSQVVASWKLGSTCDSVWPGLACTCVDLRSLWSRSNFHAIQCKFFTVWPPKASLFASSTWRYLRVRLSRALVREFSLSTQINRKFALLQYTKLLYHIFNFAISFACFWFIIIKFK